MLVEFVVSVRVQVPLVPEVPVSTTLLVARPETGSLNTALSDGEVVV